MKKIRMQYLIPTQLVYNKARQASITKELLEIVSGAEALKKAGLQRRLAEAR